LLSDGPRQYFPAVDSQNNGENPWS
jgi:hypothetical protein